MNNKIMEFEDLVSELEKIISKLEEGSLSLSEAVESYLKGLDMKNEAEKQLKSAYLKLQSVKESSEVSKFRQGITVHIENLQNKTIELLKNNANVDELNKALLEINTKICDLYTECLT